MRHSLIAVALAFLVAVPHVAAQGYSSGHLEAAEDLLVAMDMPTTLAESIEVTLAVQLRQNPQLGPFEGVMRSFMQEHMSWQNLRGGMVALYAEVFTEEELREIAAFYRTAAGRKAVALTPALMGRGMALGEQAVAEHLPELEGMIQARMAELEGGG